MPLICYTVFLSSTRLSYQLQNKNISTLTVLICITSFGFLEDLGKNETIGKIHIKTKVRVTVNYFVTGRQFCIVIIQLLKGNTITFHQM